MKSIAILLMVVAVGNGFEDQCQGAHLKAIHEKCIASHGGDEALSADWRGLKEAHDETGKCFRACVMTDCKYFNDDGKINDEVPARVAHVLHGGDESKIEFIEEVGNKCLGIMEYEENVCNNAERWSRCVIDHCESCALRLYNVYD